MRRERPLTVTRAPTREREAQGGHSPPHPLVVGSNWFVALTDDGGANRIKRDLLAGPAPLLYAPSLDFRYNERPTTDEWVTGRSLSGVSLQVR